MKPTQIFAITWVAVAVLSGASAEATPEFARTYGVSCSHCHASPPRLNERGARFLAAGYRLPERARVPTVPLAVWNTVDFEARHSIDLRKGFPSRVEVISAGPLGRTTGSYFIEWRALSQGIGGNRRLQNRSGRFEDLFLRLPVAAGGALSATVGQFRSLTQIDVSQRLSLSEPLVFSSAIAGRASADSRLTGLRGFSASGRQPGFRIEYWRPAASSSLDGWFAAATLPLTGELTIPLADAASFEFEARPKGAFFEIYRRSGSTSIGGHAFTGDASRRMLTGVVTHRMNGRLAFMGGLGAFRSAQGTDLRLSAGAETLFSRQLTGGLRLDHRSGSGRDPALLLYGNWHIPFGSAIFPQAFRLQVEHRVQPASHTTILAVSHVF